MLPPSAQASPAPKVSLLSLPNEIITLIFGYLDPERDVWSLREATPQLHEHIIQSLQGRHVDINYTLFWCCQNGYAAGLVQILGHKPNLNRRIAVWDRQYNCHTDHWTGRWRDNHKETPLKLAVGNGHKRIVEILLRNLAKVELGGGDSYVGTSPIRLAASGGYHEITTLLFAHTGPWHLKKRKRVREARMASRALTSCSQYRLLNVLGKEPAKTGVDRLATMRVLLKEGADIHRQDFEGKTHLHLMVESKFSPDILNLQTLLDLGVDPNRKNNSGNTPLHTAATRARPYLLTCHHIKLLVRYGCDLNSKNAQGRTPLHIALRELWLRRGYRTGSVFHAIPESNGGCRCLAGKAALQNPCDKLEEDHERGSPNLLIELGANVNCQDDGDNTPLHIVMDTAWENYSSVPAEDMKLLIDHGADMNLSNHRGERPIDYIVMYDVLEKWFSLKRLLDLMRAAVWMRIGLSKMKQNK